MIDCFLFFCLILIWLNLVEYFDMLLFVLELQWGVLELLIDLGRYIIIFVDSLCIIFIRLFIYYGSLDVYIIQWGLGEVD